MRSISNLSHFASGYDIHREADCAGCYNRIDPLGFALENYDPTGLRGILRKRPIVDGWQAFRKHAFSDIVGFKDAILAEKDQFVALSRLVLACPGAGNPRC